jgi:hypothetical protein
MLQCTESLYTVAELAALKAELLERGSVILPGVYLRHTVPSVSGNAARSSHDRRGYSRGTLLSV